MNYYKNITVSPVKVDFSVVSVPDAPHGFYTDWFELVVKITKAIHPPFEVPAFPEIVKFKAGKYETNPITEIYYFIDTQNLVVQGTGN